MGGADTFQSICLQKRLFVEKHESAVIWNYVRQSVPSVHKDGEGEPVVIVWSCWKGESTESSAHWKLTDVHTKVVAGEKKQTKKY